jgi:hypothetical protein
MSWRVWWVGWDAVGVLSLIGVFAGVPILEAWFSIYLVATAGLLWWRYQHGRYVVRDDSRPAPSED